MLLNERTGMHNDFSIFFKPVKIAACKLLKCKEFNQFKVDCDSQDVVRNFTHQIMEFPYRHNYDNTARESRFLFKIFCYNHQQSVFSLSKSYTVHDLVVKINESHQL
ncbi:unnamed protein product [Adineta ricciae]|uniref:Uncharacterized protein n=1 Tax=Adineta ricciae TaxID=249248 RepID=A0A814UFD3_ADIRI|nr:unnamed protein product [Adineta ricciae]